MCLTFVKIVFCPINHTNCSVLVKLDANMFYFDLLSLYYAIVILYLWSYEVLHV